MTATSTASDTGELAYHGCINDDGSQHCVDLHGVHLGAADGVAVSPDGRSVYVTSPHGPLSWFSRDPHGNLTFRRCWSDDGSGGLCTSLGGPQMQEPFGVAVSPDGNSVYVTAVGSSSISHFFRATKGSAVGKLTWDGCISDDGTGGLCVNLAGDQLLNANSVAVSPDGKMVSTTAGSSSVDADLSLFTRDTVHGGQLTFFGCFSGAGMGGQCVNLGGNQIVGADAVAVSPDSSSIYVSAATGDAQGSVAFFHQYQPGKFILAQCLNSSGNYGCDQVPSGVLTDARSIAVSPNGGSVYVVADDAGTVSHLVRSANGHLTWDTCIGRSLCPTTLPGDQLDGADSVAASSDGRSIYVLSSSVHDTIGGAGTYPDDWVTRFRPGVGGALVYVDCKSDNGAHGACVDLPWDPIQGAYAMGLSRDGSSLYVVSTHAASIAHFVRHLAPPQTTITSDTTNSRNRTATFAFKSSEPYSTFRCKLDGNPFSACRSPASYSGLTRGSHLFDVKAVNIQGTADPTPAQKSYTI